MTVQRACDICKFYRQRADGSDGVGRFILSTSNPKNNVITRLTLTTRQREGDGRVKSYGAGSIDMCDDCWERIAKPRMQEFRGRHRRVPQT